MAAALPASLQRGLHLKPAQYRFELPIAHSVTAVTVTTAVGFGFVKIADLPEGFLLFQGAVIKDLVITENGSADVSDTWNGDVSLGSVGTVDVDVGDANEANFMGSTAVGAAVAGVTPSQDIMSAEGINGVLLDNSAGSLDINLNLLVDAADMGDDKSVVFGVTGTLIISFVPLGDD